jgi:hypothetical protein
MHNRSSTNSARITSRSFTVIALLFAMLAAPSAASAFSSVTSVLREVTLHLGEIPTSATVIANGGIPLRSASSTASGDFTISMTDSYTSVTGADYTLEVFQGSFVGNDRIDYWGGANYTEMNDHGGGTTVAFWTYT